MVAHLRARVAGLVSTILAARLETHLSGASDEAALRRAVDKVRVSLRLFVDEELAEQLAGELLDIGQL
jgi:hypothetical protein